MTTDPSIDLVPDVSPELPPSTWRVILGLLQRLPQGALSRGFGAVADVRLPPPLRRPVLAAFARAVGAALEEAELPLEAYPTLNAFFTRKLKPGLRSWPADPEVAASPVDGALGQLGRVRDGRIVQAKGRWYSAADLLADPAEAERFAGGSFVTLYLSPKDYHRIHAPTAGELRAATHVPGALLPVNAAAVAHLPDLFARNERLLCYLDGPLGRVAVVAVGAYNVGRISARFDPEWGRGDRRERVVAPPEAWVTNRRRAGGSGRSGDTGSLERRRYDPPIHVEQGDELMTFHLGSTVVLLFEPGRAALRASLAPGQPIRLGQPLGSAG